MGVLAQSASSCAAQLLTIQAWASRHGLEVVDLGTSAAAQRPRRRLPARHRARRRRHHPAGAAGRDGPARGRAGRQLRSRGLPRGHPRRRAGGGAGASCVAARRCSTSARRWWRRSAAEPARRVIAFNDVVVARLPGFGLARLRVVVAGESLLVLQGDGVVIASPTGSTAYTVGAGGPAVAPSLDAIVITPLASQGTPLRSLVVDGSEIVRVELEAQQRAAEHRDRRPRDARHARARGARDPRGRAQGAARAHAPAHLLSRPGHPAVS